MLCLQLVPLPANSTEPAPLLLRFPTSAELEAPQGAGLIGAWSFSSLNKEKVEKIARFNAWLPDAMLESKARAAFACAKIGDPNETCRSESIMVREEGELQSVLHAGPNKRGFIITFQPIMVPEGLSLRVPVKELEWDGEKIKPLRTFTLVYGTRIAKTQKAKPKMTVEELKEFWVAGTPGKLAVEVDKGLAEIAGMLSVLTANIDAKNEIPKAWRDLPKIKTLEKAGRARCSGVPCAGVRIYKDTPESLWVTFASDPWVAGSLPPSIGAAMVSLDADAAKWETNVWGLTFAGY